MRYFLLRRGRIVASDTGTAYLEALAQRHDLVVTEEDWWALHWRRAILAWERGA